MTVCTWGMLLNRFDRCLTCPACFQREGYKYKETVRKKAEREELTGVECVDCKKFYAAVETWGGAGDMPACGHPVRGEPIITSR